MDVGKIDSAGPTRERFPSKIVIEAPLPPPPSKLPTVTEDAAATRATAPLSSPLPLPPPSPGPCPCPPLPHLTSCLGGVQPLYEPLKVCLDDDSSDEDEGGNGAGDGCGGDGYDDDGYFVGIDDEDINAMFKKTKLTVVAAGVVPATAAMLPPLPPAAAMAAPSLSESSLAGTVVWDEGSSVSDSCSIATEPSSSSLLNLPRSPQSQESLSSRSSSTATQHGTKRKRSRRRVSLRAEVAVVPIPRREEYSSRIRERLWSSSAELYQNASRNAIEFASEGWNWRNVTEDEDMLVHVVSGELVHPVHLKNILQMNAENGVLDAPVPLVPNRPGAFDPMAAAASTGGGGGGDNDDDGGGGDDDGNGIEKGDGPVLLNESSTEAMRQPGNWVVASPS